MANNITRNLIMPNGDVYEFYSATRWGTCSTTSTTQAKQVSIIGFYPVDIVDGRQITVRFSYAQKYNGIPYLYVGLSSKNIKYADGTYAGLDAWVGGEIITFTYFSDSWYMDKLPLPIYDGSVT